MINFKFKISPYQPSDVPCRMGQDELIDHIRKLSLKRATGPLEINIVTDMKHLLINCPFNTLEGLALIARVNAVVAAAAVRRDISVNITIQMSMSEAYDAMRSCRMNVERTLNNGQLLRAKTNSFRPADVIVNLISDWSPLTWHHVDKITVDVGGIIDTVNRRSTPDDTATNLFIALANIWALTTGPQSFAKVTGLSLLPPRMPDGKVLGMPCVYTFADTGSKGRWKIEVNPLAIPSARLCDATWGQRIVYP